MSPPFLGWVGGFIMKKLTMLVGALCLTLGLQAQPGGMGGMRRGATAPVVNADNTVTFTYQNANAKKVEVDVQFAGRHEMKKGDDGIWTLTLGPAQKDIYPYCYVVDGNQVMDPNNPYWFPNEGFKNSLLEMHSADNSLIHEVRNVPHGSVEYRTYPSKTLGIQANAIVYTPPTYYQNPTKKYPVMYLISGTTDTEEVYFKVGRVNHILDNLIAEGAAKEMIVVLPYGNPSKLLPAPKGGFGMGMGMGGDLFGGDLVKDLMPFVEANYRTLADRDHRAIGGFSRGGNQGLSIGLTNLDKFSWLCSYSSFTSTALPNVYDNAQDTNQKIHLFWLGVGTDDFLYGNAKEYMDFLDQKGIKNRKEFTTDKFGHTWMNARYFLDKSLRLLFQEGKDPYANMPAQVPPVKEQAQGAQQEEQRLTPAVMARLFPAGVKSPEVNEDGSVTFRMRDANAQKVELDCQMFSEKKAMTKGDDGVWSITVTPERPDIYPYCFVVDGTQVNDNNNMDIFPNENFKLNLVDVRGKTPSVQDVQEVAHGSLSYRWYTSSTYGYERPLCVYTPAGYDPKGKEKLPVLYLIHGMTDTYETWFKSGRMNVIMDNLIAQGKAKRMIVVMPYANPRPEMQILGKQTDMNVVATDGFVNEMLKDIMPYVEQNYNVLTDAQNRAIAGFSLGGRQTMACGLANTDKFKWVCAFAPAIFGDEYKTNFENGTYQPLATVKKNLSLFWLGTGKSDFLLQASQGLDAFLTEQNFPHTFYNPEGGHTWMNCRDYLTRIAQLIFKK